MIELMGLLALFSLLALPVGLILLCNRIIEVIDCTIDEDDE